MFATEHITTTCPKCLGRHDRGPVDGIDTFRCLRCGIAYKAGKDGIALDRRIVNGATCFWWGHISEVGSVQLPEEIGGGTMPACPHCKGMLLETDTAEIWWAAVDDHERMHRGYRSLIEFTMGKHFRTEAAAKEAAAQDSVRRRVEQNIRATPDSAERASARADLERARPRVEPNFAAVIEHMASDHIVRDAVTTELKRRHQVPLLKLCVRLARMVAVREREGLPKPGDLVVECSAFTISEDAIGILVEQHGRPGMMERYVIRPLSGNAHPQDGSNLAGTASWSNAEFKKLPDSIRRLVADLGLMPLDDARG